MVGYQQAATLGAWTLEPSPETGAQTITASLVNRDDYWMHQEPKDIWLQLGRDFWIWRNVDWSAAGVTVTGRPEFRRG